MLERIDRQIAGLDVASMQLPVMRALPLAHRLGRLLVPVLGAIKGRSLAALAQADVSTLSPALESIFKLDDAARDEIVLGMLASTSVTTTDENGKQIKYDLTSKQWIDQAFGGDLAALFAVLRLSFEVNFLRYFPASAGNAQPTPTLSS